MDLTFYSKLYLQNFFFIVFTNLNNFENLLKMLFSSSALLLKNIYIPVKQIIIST